MIKVTFEFATVELAIATLGKIMVGAPLPAAAAASSPAAGAPAASSAPTTRKGRAERAEQKAADLMAELAQTGALLMKAEAELERTRATAAAYRHDVTVEVDAHCVTINTLNKAQALNAKLVELLKDIDLSQQGMAGQRVADLLREAGK